MKFTDIKTLTIVGNNADIDGTSRVITTFLDESLSAVQFHKGNDFVLEEPLMEEKPLSDYQYALDEFEVEANKEKNYTPTLEEVKTVKIQELKISIDFERSVIVDGKYYIGGYESSIKLDSKRRLVIESGNDIVNFFDTQDAIVSLNLEDAKTVCLAVANRYEEDFYYYKTKKKQINSCATIEEIEDIEL